MKTIREWLEMLDEPYKTQAIENTTESRLMETEVSMSEALAAAFTWINTMQGVDYWIDLYNHLLLEEVKETQP